MSNFTTRLNSKSQNMAKSIFLKLILTLIFVAGTINDTIANENNDGKAADKITTVTNCTLEVNAGDDITLCGAGEVTLTASVSGQSECVDCTGEYGVENTDLCNRDHNYVLWLKGGRYFSNVDLVWVENTDGTATLSGTVFDYTHTQTTYEVDATFTGKTSITPQNSPKEHECNTEDSSAWTYYTEFTGTITRTDGTWSTTLSRMGPAFQLGNGANVTETQQGKYGACGWFHTTDSEYDRGDFNFNLGDCVTTSSNELNYLWSTGETTPTITVSDSGTYTVTVKDCEDCEATDTVQVTVTNLDVDAGDDQTICEGEEVTLTATASGESQCTDCEVFGIENTDRCSRNYRYVLWLKDDQNNVVRRFSNVDLEWQELPDGTATLKGTVVDNNDAEVFLEVDVIYSGRTTDTPQDSPKEHVCNDENTDGWVYYTEVSGTISNQDGTWSFDIERMGPSFQLGNGANVTEEEVGRYGASGWFTTNDGNFNRGDFNINIGDCISTVSSEVSYLWSTGETTQSITVSPMETTTYTVTVTDCGSCETSDSVDVIVQDPITVDAGEDQEICLGEEVTLTAEVDGEGTCEECVSYNITNTDYCLGNQDFVAWMKEENGQRRWFSNVDLIWTENPDGTATLKGTMFDHFFSQENFEVDVTFSGKTSVPPVGSPKEHNCNTEDTSGWIFYTEISGTVTQEDGSVVLNVSRRGEAFQLGNGANNFETEPGKNGASGWIDVEGGFNAIGDFNINFGDCVATQGTGIEYLWSTGETTQSITVSPTEDTVYEVTVSGCNDCGDVKDEVLVKVNNATVNVGGDQTICLGETATLTATGDGDFLWSTGETTASITVSPTETTIYSVTITNNGCDATDEVVVTVNSATVDAGDDQTICLGESATLTAVGDGDFLWSTGETTASITVSPTETTTYSVTITKDGCEAADEVVVTVNSATANAGDDVTITAGETATLTATGGGTYLWSTGETTETIQVSPNETTTYTVTVTKDGCEASDDATVFVESCDAVVDAGEDQVSCFGESVTLTATGNGEFLWSTGETTASITVSPIESIIYTVTVTLSEGCSATDEVFVELVDFEADAGEDQTIPCPDGGGDEFTSSLAKINGEVTLTVSEGDSYLWSTGETTQSIIVSPNETTVYDVTVTIKGCEDSDQVVVFVEDNCGGGEEEALTGAIVYPTMVGPGDKISIDYKASKDMKVTVSLMSISGLRISTPIQKDLTVGKNTMEFDLKNISGLSEGIYLLQISERDQKTIKKIVIKR